MDVNYNVVGKIKEIRMRKNISQQGVATSLGLTVTAYNRIENNKTQLTINNLFVIADFLETPVDTILNLADTNSANNYNSIVMANYNNGHLNISIDPQQLEKLIAEKK